MRSLSKDKRTAERAQPDRFAGRDQNAGGDLGGSAAGAGRIIRGAVLGVHSEDILSGNGNGRSNGNGRDNRHDGHGRAAAVLLDAGSIMRVVRARAETLLSQAEDKAAQTMSEAMAAAIQIEQEAYQRGYKEGSARGREEAARQVRDEAESLLRMLQSLIEDLGTIRERIVSQAEDDLLKLSLAVTEKIVRRKAAAGEVNLQDILTECLRRAQGAEEIRILVHPQDLEAAQKAAAGIGFDLQGEITVEASPAVSRGGCLLESDLGRIDARLETRFLEVSRELLAILRADGSTGVVGGEADE